MRLIVNGQEEQPVKKVKLHAYMHQREIEKLIRQKEQEYRNELLAASKG